MATNAKNQTAVIVRPVITEKATMLASNHKPVYAFFVTANATKTSVKAAIKTKYQVEPERVAIINVREKQVYNRVKPGSTKALKKALVYLPAGSTLNLN